MITLTETKSICLLCVGCARKYKNGAIRYPRLKDCNLGFKSALAVSEEVADVHFASAAYVRVQEIINGMRERIK